MYYVITYSLLQGMVQRKRAIFYTTTTNLVLNQMHLFELRQEFEEPPPRREMHGSDVEMCTKIKGKNSWFFKSESRLTDGNFYTYRVFFPFRFPRILLKPHIFLYPRMNVCMCIWTCMHVYMYNIIL